MSNVVTISDKKELFSPDQLELLKRQIAPDITNDELQIFIYQCKRTGLDPFARQIYAVKRDGKMVVQTAIDGFRLIAFRTNLYAGKDEAQFTYENDKLVHCKLTIYKLVNGEKCPFTATVRWDEYYPGEKLGFMWRKMPETMLEKCCEAKALRMAFPSELSGLYSNEEMHQAENTQEKVAQQIPEKPLPYCEYCGVTLQRSRKNHEYFFCPDWNNGEKHVKPIKEKDLAQYEDYLRMREKEKEKEMGLDVPEFSE